MTYSEYKCESCERTVKVPDENGNIPECCRSPMRRMQLDVCTQPAHPEHARPMHDEDACDDGRSGIREEDLDPGK